MSAVTLYDGDDLDEWLTIRHKYMNASMLGSWLGVSPWGSRAEIVSEKLAPTYRTFDTRNMWWGRFSEDHNRGAFETITGVCTRGNHALVGNTRWPNVACTLDGVITHYHEEFDALSIPCKNPQWVNAVRTAIQIRGVPALLEMKQTEAWNAKNWKVGAPEYYQIQLQAQLHLADYEWGVLCCKIGAADMVGYIYERDEEFAEILELVNREFEEEVVEKRSASLP